VGKDYFLYYMHFYGKRSYKNLEM